ncbi:MAG: DUF6428 family protein [Flavobacteriaceae bacterium]
MTLNALQQYLETTSSLSIRLTDGSQVPAHFHLTEIAWIEKAFIDCGNTLRKEGFWQFQLYTAEDYDHRLAPAKLQGIIAQGLTHWPFPEAPIRIEFQGKTIENYFLTLQGGYLVLQPTQTACLAEDACGIPEKPKVRIRIGQEPPACAPGSGCC